MMIKAVLLDLDGTMLPMNQEEFIKIYFGELCKRFCPILAVDSDTLIKGMWKGTEAMTKNDGKALNMERFWRVFANECTNDVLKHIKEFDDFYTKEFFNAKNACKYNPVVPETIRVLKQKGYRLIAATNPLFPSVATYNRLKWAGVTHSDFELVTTYENCTSCKPNPMYYNDIMQKIGLAPNECLMVGNDVSEDVLPCKELGIDIYLITDCLINKSESDISSCKSGSFKDFLSYVRMMPDVR